MRAACCPVMLILFVCSGCSDSHESIYRGVVESHREINDILAGVNEESDPAQVADEIQTIVERLMELKQRADQLPEPGPETESNLRREYAEQIEMEQKRSREIVADLQETHPLIWQKVNSSLTRLQAR